MRSGSSKHLCVGCSIPRSDRFALGGTGALLIAKPAQKKQVNAGSYAKTRERTAQYRKRKGIELYAFIHTRTHISRQSTYQIHRYDGRAARTSPLPSPCHSIRPCSTPMHRTSCPSTCRLDSTWMFVCFGVAIVVSDVVGAVIVAHRDRAWIPARRGSCARE